MQVPEGEDFCTTYADCATRFPDAMNKWDTFYQVWLADGYGFSLPVAALRTKKKERKTRCMVLIFDMCVCVLKGPDGCDVVSPPWQREKRRNLGSLLGGPDGRDSRLSRVHQQVSKTAALISQHALRLCRDNWLGALVQSAKLHLWNFLVLRCCGLFYWIRGFCYWSKHNIRPVCHHVGLSVAVSAVLGVVGRSCSRSQFVSN